MGSFEMPATAPARFTATKTDIWCHIKNPTQIEPMAEPVSTIGASAPTDPPKPIVSELAMSDVYVL